MQFQRLIGYFGVYELNGTIAITARCNRKSVFEDGGRQTGSTYISALRQDTNEIPKTKLIFGGFRNSTKLLRLLPDVIGSRYFNMAAAKTEVLISQVICQDHVLCALDF